MTDRPIIFSTPMVHALLDGRKTMTRRIASYGSVWMRVLPGDRLWVRETWGTYPGPGIICCDDDRPNVAGKDGFFYRMTYRAGTERNAWGMYGEPKWRSPIHCARRSSRLTLIVTNTKIERLRHITIADARTEGFASLPDGGDERHAFLDYWNELHGDGATDANPEVVAITFTVHRANIDVLALEKAA